MALTKVPSNLDATIATTQSASDNSTNVATTAYVTTAIANLVDGAPSTLNTLDEIAAALNDDAALNTTLTNSIATKLPLAGGTLTGDTSIIKSGNPSFTVKTTGAGNNPFIRIQADTNYWDIQSLFSNAEDELDFRYNGASKLIIDNTGNVGIGAGATSPSSPLHVSAAKNDGWLAQLINTGTGSDANGLDIHAGVDAADYILRLREQDGTDVMVVKYGGKVGIGTTQPGSSLELRTDTSSSGYGGYPALTIRNDNAAGYGAIHFNEGSTQRARIEVGNNSGSPYLLMNTGTASGQGIYISSNGNVGIGTTVTSNTLTVSDATNISMSAGAAGQLRIEGNGYSGAIALDGDAMHIYQNSSARDIVMGNNETEQFRITAAGNIKAATGGFDLHPGGVLQLHGNSAAWSETNPGHTKGSIHLDPDSNTNDFGNAITFGASDHNNGESTTAGIYLRTDGNYGSKMYLATSDSYATGAKMAMRINHSGHIHAIRGYITSQVPAFNAYYAGNSFAPGGNSIFPANATRFNNGNNYDTTNYRFTAPTDGVYRFYFRTITNGSASNQHLVFRKNTVDISGTNQHFSPNSGTAWCQLEMETVQDLSDGDSIDVKFVTLSISLHGNAWNEFSGHLIG